jgi:hypothetical protein
VCLDNDEEELQNAILLLPRSRVYRPLTNGWPANFIPCLSDEEFRVRFRVSRGAFRFIESLVAEAWPEQDRRQVRTQLLLRLYFLGHKMTLQELSDVFGLPKTTCWRAINGFTRFVEERLARRVIRLPETTVKPP